VPERKCGAAVCAGRLRKAREFQAASWLVAETDESEDMRDACITLCIHAGIAAADVVCCRRLGVHHQGENHAEAVGMIGRVDRSLATALATLLRKKTASGYSDMASSTADCKQARRAMDRLVEAAEALSGN
jgi:hypothetical protein